MVKAGNSKIGQKMRAARKLSEDLGVSPVLPVTGKNKRKRKKKDELIEQVDEHNYDNEVVENEFGNEYEEAREDEGGDDEGNITDDNDREEPREEYVIEPEDMVFNQSELSRITQIVAVTVEEAKYTVLINNLLKEQTMKVTGGDYTFQIVKTSRREIFSLELYRAPYDDNDPIYHLSEMSKGLFARRLEEVYSHLHLPQFGKDMISELLCEAFPFTSLPFVPSSRRTADGRRKPVAKMHEYSPPKSTIYKIESCPCGNSVYMGRNYSLSECPSCGLRRELSEKLNYRMLIPALVRLLYQKNFLDALNYINDDRVENCYVDIMDGCVWKENMNEMNLKFLGKYDEIEREEVTSVSLFLSLGWDGAQVCSSKHSNFWPIFIAVENLPPTFRKQIGVGTFLLSIFTKTKNSLVEEFLFSNCLVPELMLLNEGIEVKVNGERYFLQAR